MAASRPLMTTPAIARQSRIMLLVCAALAAATPTALAQESTPTPAPAEPAPAPVAPAPAAATPPTPAATATASLPSETGPPSSPCLDDDFTRKGVQAKTFLKRRRIELAPAGGLYASDLLSSS